MAWLKHKKEEPPEIGIGDHDFSQFWFGVVIPITKVLVQP